MVAQFFNFSEKRLLTWMVGIALFLWFLSLIQPILLPFVIGAGLAYFLDPVADRLEKFGVSRTIATAVIIIAFFALLVLLGVILVPVMMRQVSDLVTIMPDYITQLEAHYRPIIREWMGRFGQDTFEKGAEALGNASSGLISFGGDVVNKVLRSGLTVINVLSLTFITPVVSFYLLRDWDRIVARLDDLLPRQEAPVIREQMRLIDVTLAGFVRGQINVCLLLGAFYAIGLTLVGLPFGIVIGLMTGFLTIIPYVGVLFGTTVGLTVAWFQLGDMSHMTMVLLVFLLGQFIEGNFITPKLVGEKVGLHPVWIIFGLLAGGALFGFVGILLAVPATAVIGVLVRFAVGEYLKSPLYSGKA